jgi:hypothetical protein
MAWQTGLGQDSGHGVVVKVQLAGDRSDAPLLHVVIAQDLCFGIRGDGHRELLFCSVGRCFEEPGGAESPSERSLDSSGRIGSNTRLPL